MQQKKYFCFCVRSWQFTWQFFHHDKKITLISITSIMPIIRDSKTMEIFFLCVYALNTSLLNKYYIQKILNLHGCMKTITKRSPVNFWCITITLLHIVCICVLFWTSQFMITIWKHIHMNMLLYMYVYVYISFSANQR